MNEFKLIKKYFRPLSLSNSNSLMLSDDIFFDKKNGTTISVDTYVYGTHFLNTEPKNSVSLPLLNPKYSLFFSNCKSVFNCTSSN